MSESISQIIKNHEAFGKGNIDPPMSSLAERQYNGKTLTFRSVHLWEVRGEKSSTFHVYYDDAYHKFSPVHG